MQSARSRASISPETFAQAGAGALLLAVAATELLLAFWAAGWWQRSSALLVALAGAAMLARGIAVIAFASRPRPAPRVPRMRFPLRPKAPARAVLAESAQA